MNFKQFLLIPILGLVSCSGDFDFRQQVPASLEISASEMNFSSFEGTKTVSVKSNEAWSAELPADCDWLTLASDPATLTVTAKDNEGVGLRSASVLLKAGARSSSILVNQEGRTADLKVSMDTVAVEYGAHKDDITVTSNIEWTVYAPSSWMKVSVNGNVISIESSANTTEYRRNGYILIQSRGVTLKRIFVSQASSYPQVPEYYQIKISDVWWDESYIFYATNNNADTIGVITKEFLGASNPQVAEILYHYRDGKIDFSTGTKATSDYFWIKKDGSAFFTYNPASRFDTVVEAGLDGYFLESDVKTHGVVKIGDQIWLAEDYKTTKMADGTAIPTYHHGDKYWPDNSKACAITTSGGVDHYLYTGACLNGFAPEGWEIPTTEQYLTTLCNFVGNTYIALSTTSLFGATSNFKATKNTSGCVNITALGYTNTWSSEAYKDSNQWMMGVRPNASSDHVKSSQLLTSCFSIRLIKK